MPVWVDLGAKLRNDWGKQAWRAGKNGRQGRKWQGRIVCRLKGRWLVKKYPLYLRKLAMIMKEDLLNIKIVSKEIEKGRAVMRSWQKLIAEILKVLSPLF